MKVVIGIKHVVLVIILIYAVYMIKRSEWLNLKCVIADENGKKYCVREREKLQDAADMLANVNVKCKKLVDYMNEKHGSEENVQRLVNGYNPKRIMETLPTSEYTAFSENKGEKLAFCLNKQREGVSNMIDEHTLMFVALHELSHIATKSIGHKNEFWDNFKFLLQNAKECGVHDPEDYKKKPIEYCGMEIKDNPYYDK